MLRKIVCMEPARVNIPEMFDRIARRYDLVNRVLSLGQDRAWRRVAVSPLAGTGPVRVLDVAAGTGDLALALIALRPEAEVVVTDPSPEMLELARKKLPAGVECTRAEAEKLPYPDASFDAVMIGYGIRNVWSVDRALAEFTRVLKPNGTLVVLEFSLPANPILKAGCLFYLRYLLPWIGWALTGDKAAYTYLNKTIETFPYGAAFCKRLTDAGFSGCAARPLFFGVTTAYQAKRP